MIALLPACDLSLPQPSPKHLGMTLVGKSRPLLLKLRAAPESCAWQSSGHLLPISWGLHVREVNLPFPGLFSIVLLSQDGPNQKSQDILTESGKVFSEKNLQDQLLPCC